MNIFNVSKIRIITLFLLVGVLSFSTTAQKKVAVLNPSCPDGSVNEFYKQTVRGSLENAISSTDEYKAYDRTAIDRIMEEQNFQRSGVVNDAEIRQIGMMAGVDYILVSDVTAFDGYISVNVKILNVETGAYDKSDSELFEMTPPLVKQSCTALAKRMLSIVDLNSGQRKGDLKFNEGRYTGEILNGKPHGSGVIYYNSDDEYGRVSYDGTWVDGKKEGHGIMNWKDGSKYDGNWSNNSFHGVGTMYFGSGDKRKRYDGEWVNGKRQGQGTMYWNSGSKYVGTWNNNKRNGQGTLYTSEWTYKGTWKDDELNGYTECYDKWKQRYTGNYVNGNRDGEWWFKGNGGGYLKAKYNNGKLVRDWH